MTAASPVREAGGSGFKKIFLCPASDSLIDLRPLSLQQRWPRYTNPVDLATMKKTDPLIQALLDCETRLRAWINESALNADLFRRDPLTGIRTANVGVDERLLSEFEETVTRIAAKLDVG